MAFPRFWWLLALATLGQGAAFAAWGIARRRGGDTPEIRRGWTVCFWTGACAGLAYGVLQRDPVFAAGQFFAVIIMITYFRNRAE